MSAQIRGVAVLKRVKTLARCGSWCAAADQLAGSLLERLVAHVAAVLDDHAIAAAVADALDDRRRNDEHERLVHVGQRGAHVVFDIELGAVGSGPLLERLEGDIGGAGIGRLGARGAVEAGEHHRLVDAGDLEELGHGLLQHRVGAFDRASGRKLDRGQRIALVLRRDEAGRRRPEDAPTVSATSPP